VRVARGGAAKLTFRDDSAIELTFLPEAKVPPNPILVGRFLTTWAHGRRDPPARRSSEGSAWLSAMSLIDRPEGLSAAVVARINAGDLDGLVALYEESAVLERPDGRAWPSGAIRSRPSTPTCAMDDRSSLQGTSCRLSSLVTSR